MKTPVIIVVIMLLTGNTALSQSSFAPCSLETAFPDSSVKTVYESEAIYLNGAMNRFTKNKKESRVGFFIKKLKSEFNNCSEECKNELLTCEKKKKKGAVLLAVGGGILIGSLIVLPVAAPVALGAFVVGMVPYTVGGIKMNQSKDHLQKAVWLHNRDVVARQ